MRLAGGVRNAVQRVEGAIEQARANLALFFIRDTALRRVIASELPEQRRANDLKQRNAENFWKMQYKGRPERDPQFRLDERLIFQKVFERGLTREEESKELIPLWKRYHAKYAAEHPRRPETEAQKRKKARMYREAAGPNIPIPEEYRDFEERIRARSMPRSPEPLSQVLQRALRGLKQGKALPKATGKGQGLGF